MIEENRNVLFEKILEDAAKDNSTIIKGPRPGKINSREINYLIINWKKNKLYSYDIVSTRQEGELIAITEHVYSFSELIGVGVYVKSSAPYSPHCKEYFSQYNIKKDGGIPFYIKGAHYFESSSKFLYEIEPNDITEIKFFLSYKEPNSKYIKDESICMYIDFLDITEIEKEKIIKQCETVEENLKRVISITDRIIYSNKLDEKLHLLESNISIEEKLKHLYGLFISNEIDLSKFIQKKRSLLNKHNIVASRSGVKNNLKSEKTRN